MTTYDEPITTDDDVPDHVLEQQAAEWESTAAPPKLTAVPDRIIPHDHDAEAALLGACLQSAAARDHLTTTTRPDDFYTPAHGHIAAAIAHLHATGRPVDPVTVADQLTATGTLELAGGRTTLLDLLATTPATSNAGTYAQIVHRHATLRAIGNLGTELAQAATTIGADPLDVAAKAQDALDEIHEATNPAADRLNLLADTLDPYVTELEHRQTQDLAGITTGIDALDAATGGLQDSRLYTVAGRPGMGKSDVAAHLARQAALAGHTTLVVSVEMSTGELTDRWLAAETRLPATRFTLGQLSDRDWEHATPALSRLADLPLWVDDNPGASLATIRASLRRSRARLVIVDYLQILDAPDAENRQVVVTNLVRALKHIARDHEIPVVVLAQLNRGVESRIDKRPLASDLRESGAIEQESDVVIGLYRDDFYKADSPDRGVLELILLKNRGGPVKTVKAAYFPDRKQILNLAGANP